LSDQPGGVLPGTITEETIAGSGYRGRRVLPQLWASQPGGGQFCSSCGSALPAESSEATITLQPVDDHGEAGEEESAVTLVEVPHGTGVLVVKRGPEVGKRYPLADDITRAGRHPESDIFLDDITVSRRHAELVRGPGGEVRDQRRGILEWHLRQPGAD